jgi:hypothetical protein
VSTLGLLYSQLRKSNRASEIDGEVPEGQIIEVSYMSPKPGADKTWVPKASLVTAVAGLGCGVGYYK